MRVLSIWAHCDDELIFGWPLLQNEVIENHLLLCCHQDHRGDDRRLRGMKQVCEQEGIHFVDNLGLPNNFFNEKHIPYETAASRIKIGIHDAIEKVQPDFVFGHNPIGEYGHGAHRMLFKLTFEHPSVERWVTTSTTHRSKGYHSDGTFHQFWMDNLYAEGNYIEEAELEQDFIDRTKKVYDDLNGPAWFIFPKKKTSIYTLVGEELKSVRERVPDEAMPKHWSFYRS